MYIKNKTKESMNAVCDVSKTSSMYDLLLLRELGVVFVQGTF